MDTLVALKLEYKEKSGKEYGAAPPSDKEKDKKDKKEKSAKKDTVAPAAPVAAKPSAAAVRTVRAYMRMYEHAFYIMMSSFFCLIYDDTVIYQFMYLFICLFNHFLIYSCLFTFISWLNFIRPSMFMRTY